ncbi:NAD(+) diphosphatase [Bacteroides sp.]|uniref:NAD(+) diphosphatase n=1 Tax=Bacteroides sp. TaxID=29523 RepID=UPI0025C3250F|nr:NAD(+) diphosphatase [Bacteroides sp.]
MSKLITIWWFVFYKDQLLLKKQNNELTIPCNEQPPIPIPADAHVHEICTLEGHPCKAFTVSHPIEESDEYSMTGLRASYDFIPLKQYQTAGKAFEILHWDRHSRFCPVCGTKTEMKEPIMKKCPACGNEIYPSISTAILVLIRKEDSLLLVHARNFKGTFYSLVAGFLETGETLEECVIREVKEETGLDIKNITYFGNEPWPYPSGLMVGFIADYAGGEISLQDEELSSGAFYTRDNLPELPRKLSLARKMIDWWIKNN